jgi:hypothetical protein
MPARHSANRGRAGARKLIAPYCRRVRSNRRRRVFVVSSRAEPVIRIKLALIEIGTEFRVMAQHLERDPRPRSPSQPRWLKLPGEVILRLRSEKLKADEIKRSAEAPLRDCGLPPGGWTARLGREKAPPKRGQGRGISVLRKEGLSSAARHSGGGGMVPRQVTSICGQALAPPRRAS